MIKKLKENFLILLISNMLTIIMIVVAPRIDGAIANLMMTVSDSDSGFSLPMIFYYISFAIIVCAFMCLRKPQAVRHRDQQQYFFQRTIHIGCGESRRNA